jgi:hypothetical protein
MLFMGFKLFKILLSVEVVLLFVQFWLGISINLFVAIPLRTASNFSSYSGGEEVLAHMVNGVLVLAFAGLILSYGSRLRLIRVSVLSVVGVVFAVVAAVTGATFLFRMQDDNLSLTMAVSFILVYTVCLSLFFLVEKVQAAGKVFR